MFRKVIIYMKEKTLKAAAALAMLFVFTGLIVGAYFSGGGALYTFAAKKREVPVYRVDRDDGKAAISFDCAWGTDYTDKILDILDFYKIKCTFFVVEFWAEKNADYLKKISDRGHEIGTHSATHPKMSALTEDGMIKELSTSSAKITEITGKEVKLFRPPFGDYNDRLLSVAKKLGLTTVQWSVDSLDWKDLSAEEIATRVIKKTGSGDVILCHNNGAHTAESLPLIFSELLKRGITFVPIGELIYTDGYFIAPDGTQKKA